MEKDPREEAIAACLPGANCGGCGYPGCGGYAAAVAAGKAASQLLCRRRRGGCRPDLRDHGREGGSLPPSMIAQVQCTGGCRGHEQYEYVGIQDCAAAAAAARRRRPAGCSFGCLGFGSCEKAVCPFDAIHAWTAWPRSTMEKCKACK